MSPGPCALRACMAEVLAPKAGNVHPRAEFDDSTWSDFVVSAMVTAPILDRAAELGVGTTVLECVRATREAVGHNTNLGIVLLLSPLCAASPACEGGISPVELHDRLDSVLMATTQADAEAVYEAIRLANPGGLGSATEQDVANIPTVSLIDAMRLAANRDTIAALYVSGFAGVFDHVVRDLTSAQQGEDPSLDAAIVFAHLRQMSRTPDSLIARKCGVEVARETQRRASDVLGNGWPTTSQSQQSFNQLDDWLRADGRRRNPGTSADLVAAGLFVAFRSGLIRLPARWDSPLSSEPCV